MTRHYKLAANYNTVELEFDDKDLTELANEDEVMISANDEGEYITVVTTDEETLIKRLLKREYDILASIDVVNVPVVMNPPAPIDPPSDKQAEYAASLGMKDPKSHSKKEVWAYIQKHRG